VGCCVDPPYHAVLAVKVCVSAGRSLAPFGRLRTLTAALRREGFGLGQSRPIKTGVPHVAVFFLFCQLVGGRFYRVASADEVLSKAWGVLADRVKPGVTLSSPQVVKDYLRLAIGLLEHEVFCVVFLDAQHRVIELRQMFRGTVTQTSVYPREVIKESLALNAAAVILAHNHPSGAAEPSRADEHLTQTLKTALQLVDVRVIDHLVITANATVSFAERGLL
jgi:DNA repair protein RadC